MAEQIYKINDGIELSYQAPNKQSGLSGVNAPVAEIFLPNGQKDSNFPDVQLVEIGSTGNYKGSFTPNEQGTWRVLMHRADGDGQVPKAYSVGAHNVHSVGEAVGTVDGKVGAVDGKVDNVQTTVNAIDTQLDTVETKVDGVNTNVDQAETNIRGADSDTLKTLSDQLDGVDSKVSAMDTPPVAY
jgi:hypothetical protein